LRVSRPMLSLALGEWLYRAEHKGSHESAQMRLAQDDEMVDALASDRADEAGPQRRSRERPLSGAKQTSLMRSPTSATDPSGHCPLTVTSTIGNRCTLWPPKLSEVDAIWCRATR
jgi:hypothetical protein